jgi:hypothetical protein
MEIRMIVIGLVVGGIIAALAVIAICVIRGIRSSGADFKSIAVGLVVVLLIIAKFDVDPTAVECPVKPDAGSPSQGPPPRCTVGSAIGYTIASGGIGIEETFRSVRSGTFFTEAGRSTLAMEITSGVNRVSPVVAGLILLLACGLGFAKPFGADGKVMQGFLHRWSAFILVFIAYLGTLPWAAGVLLAYIGTLVWPSAVLPLWVFGLSIGSVWAIVSMEKDAGFR